MPCCGGNCHITTTKERLQRKAAMLVQHANEDKLREVIAVLETAPPVHQSIALSTANPDTLNSSC